MTAPHFPHSDTCACCEGIRAQTPVQIDNRPGLPAIRYRAGTYGTFLESMVARLGQLPALTTRDPSDPTLGVIDAVAAMADVLTFYQERIANEAYLGTATERFSLLELARLIGYELRPGVSAEAFIAFTLEDTPGSPARAAIPKGARIGSVPGQDEKPQTFEIDRELEALPALNLLLPRMSAPRRPQKDDVEIYVTDAHTGIRVGDTLLFARDGQAPDSQSAFIRRISGVEPDAEAGRTRLVWQEPLALPQGLTSLDGFDVFMLRQRAALFGHNAPDWNAMTDEVQKRYLAACDEESSSGDWPCFTISKIAAGEPNTLYLDALYPELVPDSFVVLTTPALQGFFRIKAAVESARVGFTLSSKSTKLTLEGDDLLAFDNSVRATVVLAQSEKLKLAEAPISATIAREVVLSTRVDGLVEGKRVLVSGITPNGDAHAELAEIAQASQTGDGLTEIHLRSDLAAYERASVRIFANVARATHGDSREEILGSGDATLPFQQFRLKQPPLTYVSAANPSGAESTLHIFVDDVEWREVRTLQGRGPDERVYVTRIQDDASVTVQFGDGATGARLPTGIENVRAVYRQGVGLDGLVNAEQLSVAITRPLGLKSVTNLTPATGAADPETRDEARSNAPLTVLTLSRAVSLQDYEDLANSFAGVAKALATQTWTGERRGVILTVAGAEASTIVADSTLARDLIATLRSYGDPHVPLAVAEFRAAPFRLQATVKAEPDRVVERVQEDVEARLLDAFAFERRQFAQPVALSEAIAVIQGTAGVIAVDVDAFHRADAAAAREERLPAAAPQYNSGGTGTRTILGAELLLLDLHVGDIKVIR